jgi:FkbM family methyltransferase
VLGAVARRCRRFVDCVENADDYDFETNGERRVLEILLRSGARCLLDVGANVGDWALVAHRLGPEATVHCFEVVPDTHAVLRERTRAIPRIVVNPCGLSDREEEVSVRYFPGASVLATLTEYPHERESVVVRGRVARGDDYLKERGIERVDLLKIDVEGAEERVLRGFVDALAAGRIEAVQFEYGQVSILTRFLLRDFHSFFEERGFVVGKVYPAGVAFRAYAFAHEDFRGSNFVAVKRGRADLVLALAGSEQPPTAPGSGT